MEMDDLSSGMETPHLLHPRLSSPGNPWNLKTIGDCFLSFFYSCWKCKSSHIIAASRYLDIGEVVEMDREYWYGQRMDFWDEIIVD